MILLFFSFYCSLIVNAFYGLGCEREYQKKDDIPPLLSSRSLQLLLFWESMLINSRELFSLGCVLCMSRFDGLRVRSQDRTDLSEMGVKPFHLILLLFLDWLGSIVNALRVLVLFVKKRDYYIYLFSRSNIWIKNSRVLGDVLPFDRTWDINSIISGCYVPGKGLR